MYGVYVKICVLKASESVISVMSVSNLLIRLVERLVGDLKSLVLDREKLSPKHAVQKKSTVLKANVICQLEIHRNEIAFSFVFA